VPHVRVGGPPGPAQPGGIAAPSRIRPVVDWPGPSASSTLTPTRGAGSRPGRGMGLYAPIRPAMPSGTASMGVGSSPVHDPSVGLVGARYAGVE
jgi:hypothetical protein